MENTKTVLTIAGSDSSGGAGIQADIKTCCAYGVFATCAVTAVVAENTMKVSGIEVIHPEFVYSQIKAVVEDIRPDAVKIGMLGSGSVARAVVRAIKDFDLKNIVLDPVLVASSGGSLAGDGCGTIEVILEELAPLASLITPNRPEMMALLGFRQEPENWKSLPEILIDRTGCRGLLLKGGHGTENESVDYLALRNDDGGISLREFSAKRIDTNNSHGTGCTLSSAIACGLAQGLDLVHAVEKGKRFVTEALKGGRNLGLGKGSGPLDFFVKF